MATNNVDFLPIKKPHQDEPLTPEQAKEWMKCKGDVKYFMRTYCYVMSPSIGSCLFDPRDYQVEMIDFFDVNRKVLANLPRQSGKTQTVALFLLWKAIFFKNETIIVGSYRVSATKEVMDRVRFTLEMLPDFLKPPVIEYSKFTLKFTNHSSIFGQVVTSNFARGKTPSIIYIDEVAYIEENIINDAYESFSPALDAAGEKSTSKLICTSTPQGTVGWFYRNVTAAIAGVGEFTYYKVDHTKIPNRGEDFKKKKVESMGLAAYMAEYEGAFVSTKSLLINSVFLESLKHEEPLHTINDTKYFTDSFKGKRIALACDIGMGVGSDYSVIQGVELGEKLTQILEYASNTKNQTEFFRDIIRTLKFVFDSGAEEVYLTFESNSIGQGIARLIESSDNEYIQKAIIISDIDKYGNSNGKLGITTTVSTKSKGLADLKDLIESERLNIKSNVLLHQLKTFEKKKNGSFSAASSYNDDLVMGMMLVCLMLQQVALYEDKVHDVYNSVDILDESDDFYGIY
jgi:hypothetical protein